MIAKKTTRKSPAPTTPTVTEANTQTGYLGKLKLLHRDHELPIRVLNSCQIRRKNADPATVAKYAELLQESEPPNIIVVLDNAGRHFIADGHNRTAAALSAGRSAIKADVYSGNSADAKIVGLEQNQHGLPLSLAERKSALDDILDNDAHGFSDSTLARMTGLDRHTVERRRRERESGDFITATGKMRRIKSPEEVMAQTAESFAHQVEKHGHDLALKALNLLPSHIRDEVIRQITENTSR